MGWWESGSRKSYIQMPPLTMFATEQDVIEFCLANLKLAGDLDYNTMSGWLESKGYDLSQVDTDQSSVVPFCPPKGPFRQAVEAIDTFYAVPQEAT